MNTRRRMALAALALLTTAFSMVRAQNTYQVVSSLDELNEYDSYTIFAMRKQRNASRSVMGNRPDADNADYMEAAGLYADEIEDFDEQGLIYIRHAEDVDRTASIRLELIDDDRYALRMTSGTLQGYLKNGSGNKLEVSAEDARENEACQWIAKFGQNSQVVYFLNARPDGKYIMSHGGSYFYAYDLSKWNSNTTYLGILCKLIAPLPAPTDIRTVQKASPGEAVIYNLQGQRVEHPRKGIYIRQGRKVIR